MRYNGINTTVQSIVQFAAPAVAGAVLSISTFRATLFIDILTAFIGIGLLSCVQTFSRLAQHRLPPALPAEQVSQLGIFRKQFVFLYTAEYRCIASICCVRRRQEDLPGSYRKANKGKIQRTYYHC